MKVLFGYICNESLLDDDDDDGGGGGGGGDDGGGDGGGGGTWEQTKKMVLSMYDWVILSTGNCTRD